MRWYVPSNELSQRQMHIIYLVMDNQQNTHWIKGFAGTGKTLLLMHLIERLSVNQESVGYITYTNALTNLVKSSTPDTDSIVNIKTHTQFLRTKDSCDTVLLDEVQDIETQELNDIHRQANNSIVLAGDPDQSIYEERATIEDIRKEFSPIEHDLKEIFRLTDKLLNVACSIYPEAKENALGSKAYSDVDSSIYLTHYSKEYLQAKEVWELAKDRARPGDPCVILLPKHRLIKSFSKQLAKYLQSTSDYQSRPGIADLQYDKQDYDLYNQHWKNYGINLAYLGGKFGSLSDSETQPMVYIMTYHSSKGLDFRYVFIPGLDSDMKFISKDSKIDDRRLLFVAFTRSTQGLYLSYCGDPHPYLNSMPEDDIVKRTVDDSKKEADEGDEEEFYF